jgi:transposase InsO family protein
MVETYLAAEFGVVKSCAALKLATSTYYYVGKEKRDESAIVEAAQSLIEQNGPIGYIAMSKILKLQFGIGKKRMYRIMKENGLLCKKTRKHRVKTTDSNHSLPKYENHLQGVTLTKVNQAYVGDVTQFSIHGRDAYLALLSDRFNREIVGYAVSWANNRSLVLQCLDRALAARGSMAGAIHHTDADSRYCSHDYTKRLKDMKMIISMVCDNVYENAHAESLNKTIKYKLINLNEFDSLHEADQEIARYIQFYNSTKPHSSLAWLTPVAFGQVQKVIPVSGG